MLSTPKFVNPQQRKFYLITRVFKIANIAIAAIALLYILKFFIGD